MPVEHVLLDLRLEASPPLQRRREPVSRGIPWPAGTLTDLARLSLRDAQGLPTLLQARALDLWPDGSIRWLLLDWLADVNGSACYHLALSPQALPPDANIVRVVENDALVVVSTGAAEFRLRRGDRFPFDAVTVAGRPLDPRSRFTVKDDAGMVFEPRITCLRIEDRGPVQASVRLDGELARTGGTALALFHAWLHFYAGSATVRCEFTLTNPRQARHPGGLWDLGQDGSIYLKDATLSLTLPPGDEPTVLRCSPEIGRPFAVMPMPLELYQDSSGGMNWRSRNHLNRYHEVPNTFQGYRLCDGSGKKFGLRATPIVTVERGGAFLAVAMQHFWQNFPKAIETSADRLVLRLFPHQYADLHELQGGEQKTHVFFVAFAPDTVTAEPLAWCRAPLLPQVDPGWHAGSGAIPHLVPARDDANADYRQLVEAAIAGDDTFEHKREVVDEYGWRHFGDIYADHEAVYHRRPEPLVSHYNNQYDPLAGFAYQFLRSGDPRWWALMDELAAHVVDIDTYHTDGDRTLYNHGLFWHTCHHVDADTATHRSYPRAGQVCGGGPSSEHNYTTGLLLHHFLTGSSMSRQAVIDAAQWVVDSDDGRQTIFRWLDRGSTGWASATASLAYHGPGRGAGNSINALLDGLRLTGNEVFRAKLEQLIRRCIHPADDLASRNLLDAERRWSYTVFLQALGRYLDDKSERGQVDDSFAYARAALLHYARWMAEHEYPFLDKPERLQYPTETWAAQDMRKCEVFHYAAKYAAGDVERRRFLERADFFFHASVATLRDMPTRTFARPVVILLSNGFSHAYFQRFAGPLLPFAPREFGQPQRFVPQKKRAIRRFLLLAGIVAGTALAGLCYAIYKMTR